MAPDTHRAVREACLWLPEAEEFLSHGAPSFRVRGKSFATYMVNHHGDGRIALWLSAPRGAQESYVVAAPAHYFVPPYVGGRGWIGVELNKGLAWRHVAERVREAYQHVAPPPLRARIGPPPRIKAPKTPSPGDIDPLRSARGRALLAMMRATCLALPETHEVQQFGAPVWQAGKKTFAWIRCERGEGRGRLLLCFWVGVEKQSLLTADERFSIPAYLGHNGWIAMDATGQCDANEAAQLALESYRHFALRRMLAAL